MLLTKEADSRNELPRPKNPDFCSSMLIAGASGGGDRTGKEVSKDIPKCNMINIFMSFDYKIAYLSHVEQKAEHS